MISSNLLLSLDIKIFRVFILSIQATDILSVIIFYTFIKIILLFYTAGGSMKW